LILTVHGAPWTYSELFNHAPQLYSSLKHLRKTVLAVAGFICFFNPLDYDFHAPFALDYPIFD
jgi:hypothetical protein